MILSETAMREGLMMLRVCLDRAALLRSTLHYDNESYSKMRQNLSDLSKLMESHDWDVSRFFDEAAMGQGSQTASLPMLPQDSGQLVRDQKKIVDKIIGDLKIV